MKTGVPGRMEQQQQQQQRFASISQPVTAVSTGFLVQVLCMEVVRQTEDVQQGCKACSVTATVMSPAGVESAEVPCSDAFSSPIVVCA